MCFAFSLYEFPTLKFDTLFFQFCVIVSLKAEILTSIDITVCKVG
jgi:hypothetical protein